MTVCTPDLTLLQLGHYLLPREPITDHFAEVRNLVSPDVVEFQHNWVTDPAVNANFPAQKITESLAIALAVSFLVAIPSAIVLAGMLKVMIPVILSLARLAISAGLERLI